MNKQNLGWVYILINPSYQDLIKIGYTGGESPHERAKQLSGSTGVPTPFQVIYAVQCKNAEFIERQVHKRLDAERVNQGREFFQCTVADAIAMIKQTIGKEKIYQELDSRTAEWKAKERANKKSATERPQQTASTAPKNHSSSSKSHQPTPAKRSSGGSFRLMFSMVLVGLIVGMIAVVVWNAQKRPSRDAVETRETVAQKPEVVKIRPSSSSAVATIQDDAPVDNAENEANQENQGNQTDNGIAEVQTLPSNKPQVQYPTYSEEQQRQLQRQYQLVRQSLQLAWDKIPADISRDLVDEQSQWEQQKDAKCQRQTEQAPPSVRESMQTECEIRAMNQRMEYLRGYSIQ